MSVSGPIAFVIVPTEPENAEFICLIAETPFQFGVITITEAIIGAAFKIFILPDLIAVF